ncbi:3,4-dihydroxy-2-butanone-4-phosphate synthase, partial [Salmonella enterica subsp. enterica serovar Anatum]|nr:3,4-dihydroxy-2-butanone-4-phosphate synthase [Salmonella enterica subsp. enterica serovar Anatum]
RQRLRDSLWLPNCRTRIHLVWQLHLLNHVPPCWYLIPASVDCPDDGTMARAPECIAFAGQHNMAVVTIEDLVAYRQAHERKAS